ncbi:MAG: pilus assembly protein PilM [Gammaproteobacteria bacterium]|nr:pilus assembly protein PilM [Gammaproteobacteria bacterium]MCP5196717.1 pilus assembly protein PilM [Gammaproteobacteria bacterium]
MLGIDIGPSAIKVVELSRSGTRFRVEAFAIEPLGEGMLEDRNPVDPEAVGEVIKRACRNAGTRTRRAAVAVPTSGVITRTVPMPAEFKEGDIEINISIEASQYIPYPVEEVYLDFEVKGRSQASSEMQDVVLVATRKENVDTREAALKEAGLTPVVVDVEGYALENSFGLIMDNLPPRTGESDGGLNLSKGREGLVALFDIGATVSTLYILQGNQIIFSREQGFGCDQLTLRIAEAYGLSREQAERAKRSGQVADDFAEMILEPFKQMLAEQIGHTLQFFFSSDVFVSGRYTVDSIVLIGGGAMIVGLDRVVADVLGIATMVVNPFRNMGTASRVNSSALLRDAPLLAVAGGLALRSLD